jgi:hypothetical protein
MFIALHESDTLYIVLDYTLLDYTLCNLHTYRVVELLMSTVINAGSLQMS